MHGLSKSKIMDGLQCPRLLWLKVHHPELIEYPASIERIFAMGHEVGRIAQELHPGGVLVGPRHDGPLRRDDLRKAEAETTQLLAEPGDVTIYEATFSHDGVLVRTDLFFREGGRCRVTEVKSSTRVKPHNVMDAAVQTWVLRECGVPVEQISLAHIDSTFVYAGDGDYAGLLAEEDITADVERLVPQVPGHVAALRAMLDGAVPPPLVGPRCSQPNACPLKGYCCSETAECHVSCLPRGGELIPALQAEGFCELRDVPAGRLQSADHLRVWRATCSGAAEVDAALGGIMRDLPFPRSYFDFETISFAVPIWAGTRPYEVLPVQFSCHVEHADRSLEHREFLDVSGAPPMRACAAAVVAALGDEGPVLAYTNYEERCLRWMADTYPDLAPALLAIIARIVDLHPPLHLYYYHPQMRGSWSLKAVVPTVVPELSYADLDEVHEGTGAQAAFEEAIRTETSSERREDLRRKLLAYCERDTEVMVRLVRHFEGD
jgi:hypothetical protein